MKFVLFALVTTLLTLLNVGYLNGEAPPKQYENDIAAGSYTDWYGCMAICTPGCAIPNCNQWCTRVCCGQYPLDYPRGQRLGEKV